jgi:hypothetical protein
MGLEPTRGRVNEGLWLAKLEFDPGGPAQALLALRHPLDAASALAAANAARKSADSLFTEAQLLNGVGDAYRHALWSYRMTISIGAQRAKEFGDAHERSEAPNPNAERLMDLYNNAVGRQLALDPANQGRPPEEVVMDAITRGWLQTRLLNASGGSYTTYAY